MKVKFYVDVPADGKMYRTVPNGLALIYATSNVPTTHIYDGYQRLSFEVEFPMLCFPDDVREVPQHSPSVAQVEK